MFIYETKCIIEQMMQEQNVQNNKFCDFLPNKKKQAGNTDNEIKNRYVLEVGLTYKMNSKHISKQRLVTPSKTNNVMH